MSYSFVNVNDFTPNNNGWTSIGNIASFKQAGNTFILFPENNNALQLQLSFLSPETFRIRFNPSPNFNFSIETSVAVVNRTIETVNPVIKASDSQHILIDTGTIQVDILLMPYQIKVYRNGQLIHQDCEDKNLVYIPGQEVIANLKVFPGNASYFGFGEKAGSTLTKNNYTMTFFNFDNFSYTSGTIPSGETPGPLNPSEPLYASVPLLMEVNNNPTGEYTGAAYSYGIFFDNPAQSYYNIGANDYSDMNGKYYFGALYGDMDYYFMFGNNAAGVLTQYTSLTGRSSMPPKYTFGFHQGGYGYYNKYILAAIANSYRAAAIPIDGLHIDVDFQDNYRTFTSSNMKFPNTAEFMQYLHSIGFKCSTNITPLLTNNPLDENGNVTSYTQMEALHSINGLIYATGAGQAPNPDLYVGQVSYGMNLGSNPYPYPPLQPNNQGNTPLGAYGYYADFGLPAVKEKWGEQYEHLINEIGMDMIWQDMTDPAVVNTAAVPTNTFPLQMEVSNGITYVPHAQVHNAYALNLLDATATGVKKLRPDKRTFIIARGGYAGLQRYAGLWTGDSASSWDFLQINIPEVLNLGLSGVPISGCDIGGFANGTGSTTPSYVSNGKVYGGITNYELFTRWMHLGAFLPWYRNHYNGYTKQFQEAFAYGEPVPSNCRKYIELRYRLIQLFYDAMYEWTQTGMPIVRALFLNDGADNQVMDYLNDQFFVGKDLLVAPIITQHETLPTPTTPLRNIYLPAGSDWYSFMDNQYPLQAAVPGGTLITNYYAPLNLVPVYIRAGAIIPTRELEQYVGQLPANPLTINVYPGPSSTYTLYQDDGISSAASDNALYRTTLITQTTTGNIKKVSFQRIHDQYIPLSTFFFLALLGTNSPTVVTCNGNSVSNVNTPENLNEAIANSYYWNESIQIIFIKIFDDQKLITAVASF